MIVFTLFNMVVKKVRRPRHRRGRKLTKVQKQEVKRLIQSPKEVKYFDVVTAAFFTNFAGAILNLAGSITQGVGEGQRIGQSITYKTLEFRMGVYYQPSAVVVNPTHQLRLVIFKWLQTNSLNTPVPSAILQNVGSVIATQSPYNRQAQIQGDFHVLYDKTRSIGGTGSGWSLTKHIKLHGRLNFDDPAAASGEGMIFALIIADDPAGGVSPQLFAQVYSRLWYTDS